MGIEVLKSCDALQEELEKAKTNLKGLNDNIRRIIGREPQDTYLRGDRKRNFNETRRGESNNFERQRNREPSPSQAKRRHPEAKSVFSRLSGPPSRDEDVKPKIHSRVIRELPTKQEIVDAQGSDEQSKARNKRMFGCLLGTLQKFCQEESRLKEKEKMKAVIEKKLEDQEQLEKENMKRERQTLFTDRRRQQLEIRMLELKMTCLQEFETWEKSKKCLEKFIKTKTRPHIYYKPKIMNQKCEKKLADCANDMKKEIEKRRAEVNDEVLAIESRFKSRIEKISEKSMNKSVSKHDRRNNEENDDDDHDHDSLNEQSDEENFENEQTIRYERDHTERKEQTDESKHVKTERTVHQDSNNIHLSDKKEDENKS